MARQALVAFCRLSPSKTLLLNLVEFMELDERPLPIVIRLLGALAGKAIVGILTYAQQHLGVQLKESWYETLQLWDDALKAYTDKASQASSPHLCLMLL
ncbi:hypothetical protein H5410_045663 [Solanum commersonii]|uniref:Uncharacterized protein n=1 Tax=Solanum commersonii TaxID=4109 RepID=A0A9J5XC91_SOLCO|nr:hypothetical protein H5410_045663 [Solanum commersonii]